jgi:hypothetical protein
MRFRASKLTSKTIALAAAEAASALGCAFNFPGASKFKNKFKKLGYWLGPGFAILSSFGLFHKLPSTNPDHVRPIRPSSCFCGTRPLREPPVYRTGPPAWA